MHCTQNGSGEVYFTSNTGNINQNNDSPKLILAGEYQTAVASGNGIWISSNYSIIWNKYDNILLKTGDDNDIVLRVIEIDENNITVLYDKNNKTNESILNNINIKDITDIPEAYLLNYKAQYSIILSYHSRIYK